jgi:hypothetical protein
MAQDQEILELDYMTASLHLKEGGGGGGIAWEIVFSGVLLSKNTGCNIFSIMK